MYGSLGLVAPKSHTFCAPHGGAVAPQRRKIRYRPEAKPRGDFVRPMRAAIPMLGRFLPLTAQAFLMCPILRGKMGLDTPPALAGAGERDGRGGRSPPTDVVRVGRNGALVAAFIGGSAPLPPGVSANLVPRAKRSNARSSAYKAIRQRDERPRNAETRKRQHPPTTRTKAVFSLESEGFLFDKTKRNLSEKGSQGPAPALSSVR